ncbi:hypothetical protein ACRE_045450 [Hapsidospora chrysogenum ATCC 11550]|uniref:Uncharacterized protein n=1 Tax=Hapsidospora chrysogenum (strain ATCC 11550 / CBS 779.69 / DSM 880 / IAM 14645 / JCM 23072 / IMI 49137) TaxID=857340 RepID=A0A086T5N1_HAPC1|nr:hypothetical protein ACRE_045450 [Hapsidospora chrysogenum ATCC 11550]
MAAYRKTRVGKTSECHWSRQGAGAPVSIGHRVGNTDGLWHALKRSQTVRAREMPGCDFLVDSVRQESTAAV